MPKRRSPLLALAPILVLAACGGSSSDEPGTPPSDSATTSDSATDSSSDDTSGVDTAVTDGGSDATTSSDGGTDTATGPAIKTVFIILMENHDWSSIKGNSTAPYINKTLLPMGAHAENMQNIIHPSLPNYIWLEAGDNLGITDDANPSANHQATTDHLVAYLEKKGISWKSWQEDITGTVCPLTSVAKYAPKHNPMVYFDDVTDKNTATSKHCIDHVRPYSELAAALADGSVPRYNFITPNLCNDTHDCSIGTGDTWLSKEVPKILASKAYTTGGVLFLTWDETAGGTTFGMIVLSPFAKTNYSNTIKYTHSSTLRTIQEIFEVTPLLRDAAKATNLSDMFTKYP